MNERISAKREHWNTTPMPESRLTVEISQTYSGAEMEKIKKGYLPREMEDKWFMFFEKDVLYLHRSWTGICIYEAHFTRGKDTWQIEKLHINRHPEQYTSDDDGFDARLFIYLVARLLLGNRTPSFPRRSDLSKTKQALSQWSFVGRNLSAEELEDPENARQFTITSPPDDPPEDD